MHSCSEQKSWWEEHESMTDELNFKCQILISKG